jgi:hypothetical protein
MAETGRTRDDAIRGSCACSADPFADLPPEARPRGKAPLGNLRCVVCPACDLEYWTNRKTDICPACVKMTS